MRKQLVISGIVSALIVLGSGFIANSPSLGVGTVKAQGKDGAGQYASVNGLKMYYEIHGTGGQPLILLHGGLGTIDMMFGQMIPALAKTRQVIAVELQAHGHTAD